MNAYRSPAPCSPTRSSAVTPRISTVWALGAIAVLAAACSSEPPTGNTGGNTGGGGTDILVGDALGGTDAADAALDATQTDDAAVGDDTGDDDTGGDTTVGEDTSGGCTSDQECAGLAASQCEVALCNLDTATCEKKTLDDGTLCDDGDDCTEADQCDTGACVGAGLDCDDGDPCTTDGCTTEVGCESVAAAADTTCDDGNACTEGDACDADGACIAEAVDCDDDDPCTDDSCDASSGCVHADNTAVCDDGDTCTDNDACAAGSCEGAALDCGDGNPCTDDACDAIDGCVHADNTASCEDGNACTAGDACAVGLCSAGTLTDCDDGNACTTDGCDPTSGCTADAIADDEQCDDGDLCTKGDACKDGTCQGEGVDCDDKVACTTDSCDPASGCAYAADDALTCDDDNPCTTGDHCDNGACAFSGGVDCNDDNPCTDDLCDADTKDCANPANTAQCDDGSLCTQADACEGGACVGGAPVICNDDNPCTTDLCDPKAGICTFEANDDACEDGDKCTTGDTCKGGACVATPTDCADDSVCTVDSCVKDTGACLNAAQPDGAACDDGSVCTQSDACLAGTCAGKALTCDDGNTCTDDECNAKYGCVAQNNNGGCEDGDKCTTGDACEDGTCVTGDGILTCDDDNACTTDSCDPKKGCVFTNNTLPCDDGDACTDQDTCSASLCAGKATACDDGEICTDDGCDPQSGCTTKANTNVCDDGNVCTEKDLCAGSKCVPGATTKCDDGNVCTADSCDPKKGCQFEDVKNGTVCDDGNDCTEQDKCTTGKCGGIGKSCDDGKDCTTDTCKANQCTNAFNTNPCNDGNTCTQKDVCDGKGECVGLNPVPCDDQNPCTEDLCVDQIGCVHKFTTSPCDDGQFCTDTDLCKDGQCAGTKPKNCDDGNVCTNNGCDEKNDKCTAVANSSKCSDSNACSVGDVCKASACVAGPAKDCDDDNPCTAESCAPATGVCGHAVSAKLCGSMTVPFIEGIDLGDKDWYLNKTTNSVKWGVDSNGTPGKLTGSASLNFNDGVDYDNGTTVTGSALSNFLIDATGVKGSYLTFVFFSYNGLDPQEENGATYDKRYVEFSVDGFATVKKSFQLDNALHKNAWHMETLAINDLKGTLFQVRFRFDSDDSSYNKGKGWFVDDVAAYAGPVKTVTNSVNYTDGFVAANTNGWHFWSAKSTNKAAWALDKTPATPGGTWGESLNFNSGATYNGTTASGWALSPVIDLEQVTDPNITLWFKSWYQGETTNSYDKRWVEISSDGFVTSTKLASSNSATYQGGWRWEFVDLDKFKGKRVRARFHFDTVDGAGNDYPGWFVDDLTVDTRETPSYADMITCGNKASWSFLSNVNSAKWAVDDDQPSYSPDCSLNFNNGTNFACAKGENKVSGTAQSPLMVVKTPAKGGKSYLSFWAYIDAETSTSRDVLTVTVKQHPIQGSKTLSIPVVKTGAVGKWTKFEYDISAFNGLLTYVQFTFNSYPSGTILGCYINTGKGVFIEDVMVRSDK